MSGEKCSRCGNGQRRDDTFGCGYVVFRWRMRRGETGFGYSFSETGVEEDDGHRTGNEITDRGLCYSCAREATEERRRTLPTQTPVTLTVRPAADDAVAEVARLRSASRALAGIDAATLDAVTPAAMRAVMERRGWRKVADVPWFADRNEVAFEAYDHDAAAGLRGGIIRDALVPVLPNAGDAQLRTVEWAENVATRHGDVSPAEVLAEALAAEAAK